MNVKKIFTLISAVLLLLIMTACNSVSETSYASEQEMTEPKIETEVPETNTATEDDNVLVTYFSCTGTTEKIAQNISEILSADMFEIVPENPYTEADLDYYSGGRADKEQDDPSARPAIAESIDNLDQYDTVFIGYPIWHGQAPRIISTFLENYDFSGKTIVPFCTSHSSGIGTSDTELHTLAPNATWLDGERFSGNTTQDELETWLNNLDMFSVTVRKQGNLILKHAPSCLTADMKCLSMV